MQRSGSSYLPDVGARPELGRLTGRGSTGPCGPLSLWRPWTARCVSPALRKLTLRSHGPLLHFAQASDHIVRIIQYPPGEFPSALLFLGRLFRSFYNDIATFLKALGWIFATLTLELEPTHLLPIPPDPEEQ